MKNFNLHTNCTLPQLSNSWAGNCVYTGKLEDTDVG